MSWGIHGVKVNGQRIWRILTNEVDWEAGVGMDLIH